MKRSILLVLGLVLVLVGCGNAEPKVELETREIGGKIWQVEIADTPAERAQGLMNRETLPEGHGMLFVFDTPGRHGFWMKNTLIPLDIVWLDEDMQVLEAKFAVPCPAEAEQCPQYVPQQDAKYVLEVNGGEFYR